MLPPSTKRYCCNRTTLCGEVARCLNDRGRALALSWRVAVVYFAISQPFRLLPDAEILARLGQKEVWHDWSPTEQQKQLSIASSRTDIIEKC